MSSKKLLTIFGATGNQGGSIINTVLSRPSLSARYALRGITRDPSSAKSQSLASKGVKMVAADLNDPSSLRAAIKDAYGVFGVTDFWAVMSKEIEMQQGKNIFEACRAEGVQHLVWSSLPWAEKLTQGVLKNVDHFDSKAEVEAFVEREKGDMCVSYFMPAMFITVMKSSVKLVDSVPTIRMPFPSDIVPWPLFVPQHDAGGYVMGLFEGGRQANGAHTHAVSAWTTPREVVSIIAKEVGREVRFQTIAADDFQAGYKDPVFGLEMMETMRLVGEYSYFGKGEEKKQAEYDRWLLPGAEKMGLEEWIKANGPWKWE